MPNIDPAIAPPIAKSNDDIWVEMIRDNQRFIVTLYDDPNYQNIRDSQEIEMCSSPTELQYFRNSFQ